MRIFWSWQSDTPARTGRVLVRDAIRAAIKKLKESEDIEEPTDLERVGSIHLDQDRQGLPGSPDLAQAIFEKIDAASVVIADVTIVGRGKRLKSPAGKYVKGRAFINPNVGIEVGYAIKAVSTSNLLLVVNTHYGPTEDLPFDLRHKGISLVYNISDSAEIAEIEKAKQKLISTLVPALRHYLTVSPNNQDEDPRMSFSELVDYAEQECGWRIKEGGERMEVLDLQDWIRDVVGVGRVGLYGRHNPHNYSNINRLSMTHIPKEHWKDHELVVFDALYWGKSASALSKPLHGSQKQVYCDIHVDRQQAKKYLKIDGARWRGRHAVEYQERKKRNAEFDAMFKQQDT